VIPKSVTPERIRSNFEDFKLEEEDFEAINAWGKKNRVRSNAPYEYKPQYVLLNASTRMRIKLMVRWDINVFGEDCEKGASRSVW
jgi:hypothetical protein